jgi:hypothetical protein
MTASRVLVVGSGVIGAFKYSQKEVPIKYCMHYNIITTMIYIVVVEEKHCSRPAVC